MKKYIFQILASLAICLVFSGCDKDTEDKTFIEDLPFIVDADGNLVDGTTVKLKLGDVYDNTFSASFVDGRDVTSLVKVVIKDAGGNIVDNITTEKPGQYTIKYSASSINNVTTWVSTRTVIVYDPSITTTIAGTYKVDASKVLSYDYKGLIKQDEYFPYTDWFKFFETSGSVKVNIKEIVPGFYSIDDVLIGWYNEVRGYKEDDDFSTTGFLSLNKDNTIDLLSSNSPWNESVEKFSAKFIPETGSIEFAINFVEAVDLKGTMTCPELVKEETPEDKHTYNIVFVPNGAAGNVVTQVVEIDKATALTANTFAWEGHIFDGWSTSADGDGTSYEDGAEVKNLAKENDVIVLYAKWVLQN
jgi:hypothetical protein